MTDIKFVYISKTHQDDKRKKKSYVPIASGVKKLVICLTARISLMITFRLQ